MQLSINTVMGFFTVIHAEEIYVLLNQLQLFNICFSSVLVHVIGLLIHSAKCKQQLTCLFYLLLFFIKRRQKIYPLWDKMQHARAAVFFGTFLHPGETRALKTGCSRRPDKMKPQIKSITLSTCHYNITYSQEVISTYIFQNKEKTANHSDSN